MRKLLMFALLAMGVTLVASAQDATPVETLLDLALNQDEVREILGPGNDAWRTESISAVSRAPEGAIGINFVFTQNTQIARFVIYEFESNPLAAEFVELGISSVLAQLSGDPSDVIDREEFLNPDTEEPLVDQAVMLSYREERDNQLIYLRANPEQDTAIVVLIRSNLNEDQIIQLGASQLQKLIEQGSK